MLRYLVPITLFLSIVAGSHVAKAKKDKLLWISIALVLVNVALAGVLINWFANYLSTSLTTKQASSWLKLP